MNEPEINHCVSLIIERWKYLGAKYVSVTLEEDAPRVWMHNETAQGTPPKEFAHSSYLGSWAKIDSDKVREWLTQSLMMGKAHWYQQYLREKVD